MNENWTPTDKLMPPDNQVVDAMDSGGHVQQLRVHRRLWFFPDMTGYVYFTPKFWRPIQQQNKP